MGDTSGSLLTFFGEINYSLGLLAGGNSLLHFLFVLLFSGLSGKLAFNGDSPLK